MKYTIDSGMNSPLPMDASTTDAMRAAEPRRGRTAGVADDMGDLGFSAGGSRVGELGLEDVLAAACTAGENAQGGDHRGGAEGNPRDKRHEHEELASAATRDRLSRQARSLS
ncbi:hypothetical protein GCM10023334_016800 [Nonomuraea thailandensis]